MMGLLRDVEGGGVGVGERHAGHPNARCPRLVQKAVTPTRNNNNNNNMIINHKTQIKIK